MRNFFDLLLLPLFKSFSPPPLTSYFPFSYVTLPRFPVVFLRRSCLSSYDLLVKEKKKVAFKNKSKNSKSPNNLIQISPITQQQYSRFWIYLRKLSIWIIYLDLLAAYIHKENLHSILTNRIMCNLKPNSFSPEVRIIKFNILDIAIFSSCNKTCLTKSS